ncbi:type IV pilin protein [Paraherbaspirillum soli]|uniref:Type IV pilin protein n=2 Tax=Paraherbaspirillum soli TaxID=631222 RepID=A0ABW0M710_9BURK
MKCGNKHVQSGFTLIELMIVVVVIAILAAVATPSYRQYVQRGDRAQAMATMLQASNWLQQQYTVNNSYLDTSKSPAVVQTLPSGLSQSPPNGTSPKYDLTIDAAGTATTFLIVAKPRTNDKCGTFTLDNTGARSLKTGTYTSTIVDCWAGR